MIVESLFFIVYLNYIFTKLYFVFKLYLYKSSEQVVTYTYNVGSSNVHLIMILFCLGWSGNLCLILYLQKEHIFFFYFLSYMNTRQLRKTERRIMKRHTEHKLKKYCIQKGIGSTYLCCFNDFSKVFQDGLDIIFQSLVIALQQSLFALRENSLSSHCGQERQYTVRYLII